MQGGLKSPRSPRSADLSARWVKSTTLSAREDPMMHKDRIQKGIMEAIRNGQTHFYAFRLNDAMFMPSIVALGKRDATLWCPSEDVRDTLTMQIKNDEEPSSGYLLNARFYDFVYWVCVLQQCGWTITKHQNSLSLVIFWHASTTLIQVAGETLYKYNLVTLSPVPETGYLNKFEKRIERAMDSGQTQASLCLIHITQSYDLVSSSKTSPFTVSETRELLSGADMWASFIDDKSPVWYIDPNKFSELILWITQEKKLRWSLRFQKAGPGYKILNTSELHPWAVLITTWAHI
jgi:hypothetical protein